MTYDNTKLRNAVYQWLHERCIEGFGEVYCGDLLNSFIDFIEETGMMSRSPGRVVFGKELARLGFEKRKIYGITFWSGIRLNTDPIQRASRPQQYAKLIAERNYQEKLAATASPETRKDRETELAEFHAKLEAEERMWKEMRSGRKKF